MDDHPIWGLYDEYRTARFSVRYYERQLKSLRLRNIMIESIIALSVSSGIAGLWLWGTAVGGIVWKILVTIAAFLSVLKPLIKLSDQIQLKSEILTKWRLFEDALHQLIIEISQNKKYDEDIRNRFLTLMRSKSIIIRDEPSESVNLRLREECYEQVNLELPMDKFFVPED